MATTIVETKLHVPAPRRGIVDRARLVDRLRRSDEVRLTLVSAPAGFGKTTLLSSWLAATNSPARTTAWLSLDQRDNDPVTFWRYVASALEVANPDLASGALALLEAPGAPLDSVVTSLINALDEHARDLTLVIDDYHLIEAAEIHESVEFLISHLPPNAHLVLATRSDPGFPLAQLRARGHLIEVRVADLRFREDEAADYLNGSMQLDLGPGDVNALEARTEGWIAALQLAALSVQGRDDVSTFIAGFAGDDRYIVDYLVEEVLLRQSDAVREFLMRTCILERLTGALCDALTGQADGREQLVALYRGNLFLVPLDDRGQWYRYHHLFADVLRAHLYADRPEQVAQLHVSASDWFADADLPAEAIRHALAGRDDARAAAFIELASPALQQDRQEVALRDWIASLPSGVVEVRPVLSNVYAGALLSTGKFDRVEKPLSDAERYVAAMDVSSWPPSVPAPVIADQAQFALLPAATAVHRAGFRLVTGDLDGAVASARTALDLSASESHLVRASSTALIGLATWYAGDLVGAERAYADCLDDMTKAGHHADVLGCSIALGDIRVRLGRLRLAEDTYRSALRLSDERGGFLRGSADMLTGLAELHLDRNDVTAAEEALAQAQVLGDIAGLPQYPYRRRVAEARICVSKGQLGAALALLEEALPVFTTDFSPDVRPIPALIARLHLAMGRFSDAEDWVRAAGLSADDELTYVREFDHVTFVHYLLELQDDGTALQTAADFLDRLLADAKAGERTASVIDIEVIRAIALQRLGRTEDATASLLHAYELAEPAGYASPFVAEADRLASVVRSLPEGALSSPFVRHARPTESAGVEPVRDRQSPADSLSPRETEVLRLLATDLDGPDIARHLFVSLNTMRTHTRSIYTKLDVTNRRAAVRRARELGLVD